MNKDIPTFPQFNTKFGIIEEDYFHIAKGMYITFETHLRILHNGTYYLTPCIEKYQNTTDSIDQFIIKTTQRFIYIGYVYSLYLKVDTNHKDSFNTPLFWPDPDQRTPEEIYNKTY